MLHDIEFHASTREILDCHGNIIPDELGRGVYRDDNNKLLGIVGRHFKPIQHTDVLGPILIQLENDGYTIDERNNLSTNSMYDLVGRKGAFLDLQTTGDGLLMRADIVTGDFINVTGKTAYLPEGDDTFLRRYTVLNGLDTGLGASMTASWERIVCMNGITATSFAENVRARATKNLDVNAMQDAIAYAATMMGDDAERFAHYVNTPVSRDDAEAFFKATYCKLEDSADGEARWSKPTLRRVMELFDAEPRPTAYAMLQAITAHSTHHTLRRNADPIKTGIRREGRVAGALNSPEWGQLLAA